MEYQSEFDTILEESLASAAGSSSLRSEWFEQNRQAKYQETYDLVTAPPAKQQLHYGAQIIEHPSAELFDETDIEKISKVRLLGRAILDIAKVNITSNPRIEIPEAGVAAIEPAIYNAIYDPLATSRTREASRLVIADNEDTYQHRASPARLETYPYGLQPSCLGVAITAAALCELAGVDEYVLANEIRSGDTLVVENNSQFTKILHRYFPELKEKDSPSNTHLRRMLRDKDAAAWYDFVIFGPSNFSTADRAKEYHHYVVAKAGTKGSRTGYYQVDPYSLNSSELWGIPLDSTVSLSKAVKNPSVVMNHEEPLVSENVLARHKRALPIVQRYKDAIEKNVDKEYKSTRMFDAVKDLFVEGYKEIHSALTPSLLEIDEEAARETEARMSTLAYRTFRVAVSEYYELTMADDTNTARAKKQMSSGQDDSIEELFSKAKRQIEAEIKTNTAAREGLKAMLGALMISPQMQLYMQDQAYVLGSVSFGLPSVAAEFAEPEFMIGAMYMNHYATHRKNGIINIAKELSRLSPSQLLWLSAHQEVLDDERIAAVDAIIKSLPEARVASSVNIARHIV